jgi:hypothetical protein
LQTKLPGSELDSRPSGWASRRRLVSLGLPWLLLIAGLAVGGSATAHLQSYSFAFTWCPAAGECTPVSHNDAGGPVTILRLSEGRYRARFLGLGALGTTGGHIQVSSASLGSAVCQVESWSSVDVIVACFDSSGSPIDVPLKHILFLKPEPHMDEIAYAFSNDPTPAAPYIPDLNFSFNPSGGDITITRSSAGSYLVEFDGFNPGSVNDGNVQVVAHGASPARCKTISWTGDFVQVKCFDPTGVAVDTQFNVLYLRPGDDRDGLAFAWLDTLAAVGTPSPLYTYNAGGGAVISTKLGTGEFELQWIGFDAVGIDSGHVQVTSYGSSDAHCSVATWSTDTVRIHCFDSSGTPTDSQASIFYWKTPRAPLTQDYAFAYADSPTVESYPAEPTTSYNRAGLGVTINRTSVGTYRIDWPGMDTVGSDGGNVTVSTRDMTTGFCKVESWGDTTAWVICHDTTGALADRAFSILFMKPDDGTHGVAYAYSHLTGTAAYDALANYAHNPTGGAVQIARAGTGSYTVTFVGYSGAASVASYAEVTAYGNDSHRCQILDWVDDTVSVLCNDTMGLPVDARFTVLYLRPDGKRDGLAFGWANPPTSLPSVEPLPQYSYNSGEGPIDFGWLATGSYFSTFEGFEHVGIPGHLGNVHTGPFTGFPLACRVTDATADSVDTQCVDDLYSSINTSFQVLMLKPIYVPEPDARLMLVAGLALLPVLVRLRRWRGEG